MNKNKGETKRFVLPEDMAPEAGAHLIPVQELGMANGHTNEHEKLRSISLS